MTLQNPERRDALKGTLNKDLRKQVEKSAPARARQSASVHLRVSPRRA